MNIYSEITHNKIKTYVITGIFFIFLVGVLFLLGKALGYSGPSIFIFAFLISFVTSFFSYYYSDKIVLAMHRATPAKRSEFFDLYTVTENLAIAAGIPKPRVYVIHDRAPNAFATGRNYKYAIVVVTTGLLDILDRRELEGVIAHELSHIKNYDMLLMTIVSIMVGLLVYATDFFMRSLWFGGGRRDERGSGAAIFMVLAVIAAILAPILATLMQLAVSRRREFLADASGAYLTRYPEGLARALEKIAEAPYVMRSASNATAHLFIENPFKQKSSKKSNWFIRLFSTHPSVVERVAKLRAL